MTILWIMLALLAALVIAVAVVWPVMRQHRSKPAQVSLMTLNVQVFEERLAELQRDYDAQRLLPDEFAEQKTELERQLLASQDDLQLPVTSLPRWQTAAILLLVPLIGLGLYGMLGFRSQTAQYWDARQQYGQLAHRMLTGVDVSNEEFGAADGVGLLQALQSNVWQHPRDTGRWLQLSQAYLALEATEPALQSLERATRLAPDEPAVLMQYAQTRFLAQNGQLDAASRTQVERVLQLEPAHEGALMLLAMGAFRQGQYADAASRLEQLKQVITARGGNAGQIDQALVQARQQIAEASRLSIPLTIRLDRAARMALQSGQTLFVFVRAAQGAPLPYAARRLSNSDWGNQDSLTILLTPQDAMMPQRTLALAQTEGVALVAGARITASGQPIAQPGDWESSLMPVIPGKGQPALLLIDRQRQAAP